MFKITLIICLFILHICFGLFDRFGIHKNNFICYNNIKIIEYNFPYRDIADNTEEEIYEDECDIFAEALKETKDTNHTIQEQNAEPENNTKTIEKESEILRHQDKIDNINENNSLEDKKEDVILGKSEIKHDKDLVEKYSQNESDCIVNTIYLDICILDKYTGKRHKCRIKNEETYKHYNFYINLVRCVKNINPFNRDSLGFFQVYIMENNMNKKLIFAGWISKIHPCINNIENMGIIISILN